MSGLGGLARFGSLARMGSNLADAEVAASWPILGPIQYLFSMPGVEAIGGVTLGSFLYGVVQEGLMGKVLAKGKQMETLPTIGTGLISAVVMWELGRLVGSGNLAKFGAFYALGKTIDSLVMKPYVVDKIFPMAGYFGQARIPDTEELRGLGQARIADDQELRALAQARIADDQELRGEGLGQRIITEEELLGEEDEDENEENEVEGVGEEDSSVF